MPVFLAATLAAAPSLLHLLDPRETTLPVEDVPDHLARPLATRNLVVLGAVHTPTQDPEEWVEREEHWDGHRWVVVPVRSLRPDEVTAIYVSLPVDRTLADVARKLHGRREFRGKVRDVLWEGAPGNDRGPDLVVLQLEGNVATDLARIAPVYGLAAAVWWLMRRARREAARLAAEDARREGAPTSSSSR